MLEENTHPEGTVSSKHPVLCEFALFSALERRKERIPTRANALMDSNVQKKEEERGKNTACLHTSSIKSSHKIGPRLSGPIRVKRLN